MNKRIRYFLATNILIGWGVFYTKVVLDEKFLVDEHLPFELCNLMQMIILYVVITNKVELLDKIMYPSILGLFSILPLYTYFRRHLPFSSTERCCKCKGFNTFNCIYGCFSNDRFLGQFCDRR